MPLTAAEQTLANMQGFMRQRLAEVKQGASSANAPIRGVIFPGRASRRHSGSTLREAARSRISTIRLLETAEPAWANRAIQRAQGIQAKVVSRLGLSRWLVQEKPTGFRIGPHRAGPAGTSTKDRLVIGLGGPASVFLSCCPLCLKGAGSVGRLHQGCGRKCASRWLAAL